MLRERVDSARLNELARNGASLERDLSAADFERLPVVVTDEPTLHAVLRFDVGPERFPRIAMSVRGELELECQRCLQPMGWRVELDSRLSILDSEEQTELVASPFDSILMDAEGLSLATMIEDEILAALPIAPVHTDDAGCQSADAQDSNSAIAAEPMQQPFADLADLMGGQKKRN